MIKRGLIIVLLILVSGCVEYTDNTAICDDGRKVSLSEGCILDDGLNYFEEKNSKCAVGGCSSQICTTEEKAKDLVTTCEYMEEFGCLGLSNCKIIDGECGWEETPEYLDCLEGVNR
ncbi:MAG: hypothetical protein CMH62_01930 [Nanoarchaeota archaeon]|nr:hypothetical protein [Nanoarchaeota archaeon]|tara:strand:+ start:1825 stop:2175 length:351 start_codon:yes stop_codon:yes gene_type:complete